MQPDLVDDEARTADELRDRMRARLAASKTRIHRAGADPSGPLERPPFDPALPSISPLNLAVTEHPAPQSLPPDGARIEPPVPRPQLPGPPAMERPVIEAAVVMPSGVAVSPLDGPPIDAEPTIAETVVSPETVVPPVVVPPVVAPPVVVPAVLADNAAIAELFESAQPIEFVGLDPAPVIAHEPQVDQQTTAAPMLRLKAAPAAPKAVPTSAVVVPAEVGAGRAPSKHGKKAKPSKKRTSSPAGQKGHAFRTFFVIMIVIALLGGAGYVGWHKYLRKSATWASDLQPTAAFVEKTLHRSFDKTVPVVTLLPQDYQLEVTKNVLHRLYPNPTVGSDLGTGAAAAAGLTAGPAVDSLAMRAVGLVGDTVPDAVGPILAARTTSFYDGAGKTIYRMDGTTALFQVDLIRSMSTALIDQDIDFSGASATMSDAQRIGMFAVVDGIANQVVRAKFNATPSLEPSMVYELQKRMDGRLTDSATPLYLFAYLSSYEQGAAGFTEASPDNPLAGLRIPSSDAPVFDPARADAAPVVVSTSAAAPTATTKAAPGSAAALSPSTRSLGMEFWFEALVPTIGVESARHAALLWTGDSSNPSVLDGKACISSTITTADAAGQARLLAVMTQWAATRPQTSVATAVAASTAGVTVSMCEPVDPLPVPEGKPDEMKTLFDHADSERAVLARAEDLGLPDTAAPRACFLTAFRSGSITNYDPASNAADMIAKMTNVILFCKGA